MQTDLKSDNFCGFNQESAPYFWLMMPGQYRNTYPIGEVGVPVGGGAAGSYPRPELVDTWSFLSGRDNVLSKCTPPVPNLGSLNKPIQQQQQQQQFKQVSMEESSSMLAPKYTKERRSLNNLDSIDYNRYQPKIITESPQNPRYVIEGFANQRGGFNTRNFIKNAWNTDKCSSAINPTRLCGQECADVTGYNPDVLPFNVGKPPGQPEYPFVDVTSQQIVEVGAAPCGEQFFSGLNFDEGSCPAQKPQVFKNM